MRHSTTQRYLHQWSEAGSRELAGQCAELGPFEHAAVVPAFNEGAGLVEMLASVPDTRALVVCVLNAPEDANEAQLAGNRASDAALREQLQIVNDSAAVQCYRARSNVIAVAHLRTKRKQGVGQARKFGLDALCWLQQAGTLRSPWLHSTDADTRLSSDYFEVDATTRLGGRGVGLGALIHPFSHVPETPRLEQASAAYETRLLHHAAGLSWARSPYAYPTIGSTIAVDAQAYAMVRGVPKRAAGEDFYLLNKLAKVAGVAVGGGGVRIAARLSDRVPFGTGPALSKALGTELPRCYEPTLFEWLKRTWLAMQQAVTEGRPMVIGGPPELRDGLSARGVPELIANLVATELPTNQRQRRLQDSFDGFATMKLLHAWRERGLPDVPVEDAIGRSPWFEGSPIQACRL